MLPRFCYLISLTTFLPFPSCRLKEEVKLSVFHHLLFREARRQRLSTPAPPQGQGPYKRRRRPVHRRERRRQRFWQQQPVFGGRRGRRRRGHRKRGSDRAQVRQRGDRGLVVGGSQTFITGETIGYSTLHKSVHWRLSWDECYLPNF